MIKSILHEIKDYWTTPNTDSKTLLNFAVVILGALVVLSLFRFWSHDWSWDLLNTGLIVTGLFLLFLYLVSQYFLLFLYRIWMTLAVLLGFVMTTLILSVVFYLVITPIGIVMRLSGKDPLDKRFRTRETTYWLQVDEPKAESWKKQY